MNDLKNTAPGLSKLKNEQPFSVPDHYFDDFSSRLQMKLDKEKEEVLPQKKTRIVRFLKPAIGLAASFLLVFILVYWPVNSFLPRYLANRNEAPEMEQTQEETYFAVIERMDENTFYSILEDQTEEEEPFNDTELMNYVSSNISEYELYLETDY